MVVYCIQTFLFLGLGYSIFYLFLRLEKDFKFNRFFLLGSLMLCLLSPLIQLETSGDFDIPNATQVISDLTQGDQIEEQIKGTTVEIIRKEDQFSGIKSTLLVFYFTGVIMLLIRFCYNLWKISKTKYSRKTTFGRFQVLHTEKTSAPFSFFNLIFLPNETQENLDVQNLAFQHELGHCTQRHSIDIVLIEFIACIFWFNPFVWLYRKAISVNHEYLADQFVLNSGISTGVYAQEIIQSFTKADSIQLTSGFSYLQTKNRLIMLQKSKKRALKRLPKLTVSILLFGLLVGFNSFTLKNNKNPLTVIIDAGHGGTDAGAQFEGVSEKDISLSISKYLVELGKKGDIKFIMTRSDDKQMTLADRVEFINNQKADLFLSLHCNLSPNKEKSGVEAFYFDKGDHSEESYQYCKSIVANQLLESAEKGEIKTAKFYVLKNTNCPGVLLELGFLSNQKEREKLQNDESQKRIAKAIYEGLTM